MNVRDFGAIGDGSAHPLSGVIAGWTLAQWQAVFPFATALSNNIDGLAIQAAINAAHAIPTGGRICVPPGRYVMNTALTDPGVSNTNSNPPLPEIELVGDGMLQSVLSWPADMGTGTFAFASADRSTASYSRLKIRDIAIVGPGCGSTYGSSTTLMGGVGASMNWTFERCWISGFYYGVALRQDHQKFIDCQICNNYYNVYFQGAPSGTDNYGNQYFRGCALGGCLFASVACAWNSSISSAVFDCTEVGFGPYGFYREAVPGGSTVTLPWIANTQFLTSFSENCGNGVFYGENAADQITQSQFSNWTNGMTGSGYNISARALKAPVYGGSLTNCTFVGGDLTGNPFNCYSLAINAILQMQSAIQSNSFGGAYNLVAGSSGAKPALLAPTVLFNRYDTTQGTGRFLVAQAALTAGVPLSENGFDQAVAWVSGKQFAGIAMAPASAGGVVPVSNQGVALATKSSSLTVNQGDPISTVTGGVTNTGALSGSIGIAWEGAASGTTSVYLYMPPNPGR